jgi:holin-like protein
MVLLRRGMKLKLLIMFLQICFLCVFQVIGTFFSAMFRLPIPGSIVGLVLLFLLLQLKIVKVSWVDIGANWLLAEMVLFFVPSAVGVIQYKKILEFQGIKIMLVIVLSTIFVMAFTGLSAEILARRKKGRKYGTVAIHR